MKALELREEQSRCLFLVYPVMFLSLLNLRNKFHLTKQLQNIKNTGLKVQDKKALTVVRGKWILFLTFFYLLKQLILFYF